MSKINASDVILKLAGSRIGLAEWANGVEIDCPEDVWGKINVAEWLLRLVGLLGLLDDRRSYEFVLWCLDGVWHHIPEWSEVKGAIKVIESLASGEEVKTVQFWWAARSLSQGATPTSALRCVADAAAAALADDLSRREMVSRVASETASAKHNEAAWGMHSNPAQSWARAKMMQVQKIRELWGDDVREKIRAAFAEGA